MKTAKPSTPEVKEPKICLCGCDLPTKGGKFLPGHDAKLKYRLIDDAIAGKKRALTQLEKLGWVHHYTLKLDKINKQKAAKSKPPAVTIPDAGAETDGGGGSKKSPFPDVIVGSVADVESEAPVTDPKTRTRRSKKVGVIVEEPAGDPAVA